MNRGQATGASQCTEPWDGLRAFGCFTLNACCLVGKPITQAGKHKEQPSHTDETLHASNSVFPNRLPVYPQQDTVNVMTKDSADTKGGGGDRYSTVSQYFVWQNCIDTWTPSNDTVSPRIDATFLTGCSDRVGHCVPLCCSTSA